MKNYLVVSALILFILPSAIHGGRNNRNLTLAYWLRQTRDHPSHAASWTGLARAYEDQGDYSNAVRIRRRCIELEPDRSDHRVRLARNYLKLGRPDRARPVSREAVRDFDRNAEVWSAHASVEYQMGNYQEALDAYGRSLELGRNTNAYLLAGIAKCCRELKDHARADRYFLRAVATDPGPWSFYEYGKLLEDRTNRRRAVWAYEKSRALSYREKEETRRLILNRLSASLYALAMDYQAAGNADMTARTFRKILDDRELRETRYAERAEFWLKRLKKGNKP